VISGEEALVGLELGTLLDQLVGDGDRSLLVDDFDGALPDTSAAAIVDALCTPPLFTDRRIVVVRSVHEMLADAAAELADGIASMDESTQLVVTHSGRLPKPIADALKKTGASTIGANVGGSAKDRQLWVESHLVEAGLRCGSDAVDAIARHLGEDHSRLAGIVETLVSTYGEGAKLNREAVEPFLGEAGGVKPWDLTDAIDVGDVARALVMLHRMIGPGDSHPLQILALLSNRYAQMMRLDGREVPSAEAAAHILGGKAFTAGKVLDQYKKLGSSKVAQAVSLLAQADVDLRGGKDWPPELVMEVLIARLSRLAGGRGRITSRR